MMGLDGIAHIARALQWTNTKYKLFRKDRQKRQGGGVTISVKKQFRGVELFYGMDNRLDESTSREASKEDLIAGVCYRPSTQSG